MIKLYKNITPNANNMHYYFTNFSLYLTELGTPFASYTQQDYQINNNVVLVSMNESDAKDITYIIDDVAKKCWHVDFYNYQSGMAVFNCSVDYWATYIANATLSNIRVKRCNRNVGIGVYDAIAVTKDAGVREIIGETYDTGTIIFSVVMTIKSATATSPSVTAIKTYGIRLIDNQLPAEINTFDKLIDVVSGINEIVGTGGISTLTCQVINAYLCDDAVINVYAKSTTALPTFKFVTKYTSGTKQMQPTYELIPHTFNYEREIEINPNYEYYVGTKHYGIKLARTTEAKIKVNYEFMYKIDGMQVLVKQGGQTLDITEAFKVGLTTNEGAMTTQEKISKAIGTIGSFVGGATMIASGQAVMGTLAITNAMANALPRSNAGYVGGGDGLTEFGEIESGYGIYKTNWQQLTKYISCDNEQLHARVFGANFNQQIDSLNDLSNYDLLGTGTLTDTFVQCDLNVGNVPTLAQQTILTKLNDGVYLKCLTE